MKTYGLLAEFDHQKILLSACNSGLIPKAEVKRTVQNHLINGDNFVDTAY